jgi:hypothetical protein
MALFGERPDETVLRLIFRGLLVMTVVVLGRDLYERAQAPEPQAAETLLPGEQPKAEPFLPSSRPQIAKPATTRKSAAPELRNAMVIELVADGRLEAKGAITPGTAERFKAEIDKRGAYVKTVVVSSPGGSVHDALAMGKLIREKGLATRVESDGLCASSCPLVFAGGTERSAGKGAAIGVHQVIAFGGPGMSASDGMNHVQKISATCQRYLTDMGVDTQVWTHAMETPPEEIFYFTDKEMADLKLVTPAIPASAQGVEKLK